MSGKKLQNAIKNCRVVALASKKRKDYVTDEFGQIQYDKNGEPLIKDTQLYNIYKMR
jgi:hypothetical protein